MLEFCINACRMSPGNYLGTAFTTVKDRKKEIGPGLLKAMLKDLGLTEKDLK